MVVDWACELLADLLAYDEADHPVEFRMQSVLRLVSERFGVAYRLAPPELELEFWQGLHSFAPEPGIADVLEMLKQRGISIGVVSNSIFTARPLEWELDRHGLLASFRFVVATADYGVRKPHTAVFQTALAKLGLQPEQAWFVGDTYPKDVVGAIQSGMTPVWYNPLGATCEGETVVEIRHWSEFGELLDESG